MNVFYFFKTYFKIIKTLANTEVDPHLTIIYYCFFQSHMHHAYFMNMMPIYHYKGCLESSCINSNIEAGYEKIHDI